MVLLLLLCSTCLSVGFLRCIVVTCCCFLDFDRNDMQKSRRTEICPKLRTSATSRTLSHWCTFAPQKCQTSLISSDATVEQWTASWEKPDRSSANRDAYNGLLRSFVIPITKGHHNIVTWYIPRKTPPKTNMTSENPNFQKEIHCQ